MKRSLTVLALTIAAVTAGGLWYVQGKRPVRDGELPLAHLQAPVTVRYDERGVPHIAAENQADLYRALGYVHAQDRLFQMELMRRLARGELAEILGAKLVDTDRLFRTLRIREHADAYAAGIDRNHPAWQAAQAYLDGINQYQASRPLPVEFDLLGIQPRPFTLEDCLSVAGYNAYSFATALRSNPLLTYVRDQLGPDYLDAFDIAWHPDGVIDRPALAREDWRPLGALAQLSLGAFEGNGLPQFEGSNAWVVSGARSASGKPLLAGDPHIRFAVPAVWYEAHLNAPGYELYGHFQALTPFAMLGHNRDFAWSLTMFQNDDLDLIAEKNNPDNPNQVWYRGQWVDLESREETIRVKDADPVTVTLRRSPHGPLVNDALDPSLRGQTPIAMWWAFLETENPIVEAFYALNRADTLDKARAAASQIHAPGLNVVYANAKGDIGWWAAAKLPRRPAGVNPAFILDASRGEAEKDGFYPFEDNPHEENPARGYIVSANYQPVSPAGIDIPGYYNLPDRGRYLNQRLGEATGWDLQNTQALQLATGTDYPQRVLQPLLADLRAAAGDEAERTLVDQLAAWDGRHELDSVPASLFNQFLYELARAAMADELGEAYFATLLNARPLDFALPRLAADSGSPWWDDRTTTSARETRSDTVKAAWQATLAHLRSHFGDDPHGWAWGSLHNLAQGHPLGLQKPLDKVFNLAPLAAPGGHETPNNLSHKIGPAPWSVVYGPSTRRLIDFADPAHSLGINPVGQSGVLFDAHYSDQAERYIEGGYQPQHLAEDDVQAHTQGLLRLVPAG